MYRNFRFLSSRPACFQSALFCWSPCVWRLWTVETIHKVKVPMCILCASSLRLSTSVVLTTRESCSVYRLSSFYWHHLFAVARASCWLHDYLSSYRSKASSPTNQSSETHGPRSCLLQSAYLSRSSCQWLVRANCPVQICQKLSLKRMLLCSEVSLARLVNFSFPMCTLSWVCSSARLCGDQRALMVCCRRDPRARWSRFDLRHSFLGCCARLKRGWTPYWCLGTPRWYRWFEWIQPRLRSERPPRCWKCR